MKIKNFIDIKSLLFENKGTKQTIFKNTFWLMLAEGISKGLMFFLTILIARYLGAAGYGKFSFAFTFVALFAVIADFGLSTLTIREVARDKSLARKYIDNIAVIKLILGIITFVLIITVIQFLGKTPEIKSLVYLTGIWVVIQSFTQFFQSIFRAFEKMQYEALSKIAYSILLFLIAGSILWKNLGIKLLISSYIVAGLIAFVLTLILVQKNFTKFWAEIDFGFWKELLKEAWPFALFGVFAIIYFQIDIIMLSLMRTDLEVGLYSAVFRLVTILLILPGIIISAVFPNLSILYNKNTSLFKRLSKNVLNKFVVLGTSFTIILIIFSKQIIYLIYGLEYLKAAIPLQIIALILPFRFANYLFGNTLSAMNKQRVRLYSSLACAVFNILTNLIFIPILGIVGAAITTLFTELLLLGLYNHFFRKELSILK